MILTLIALAAFTATLIGGLFAIYLKDSRHLVLGFSAGAVIGVAFFDLMPESIDLGAQTFSIPTMTSFIALGFILYMLLDRLIGFHSHADDHHEHNHEHETSSPQKGQLGASSLSFHSFLDGVGIGLAFQVSTSVGVIVTAAVLAHDFSDGINTVNLVLRNHGSKAKALKWLLLDAVAPILGIISTLFFTLAESTLGVLLAIFCGFFLYIGASDLLPESHHNHPKALTTVMTVLGLGTMFIIIRLAGV